MVHRAQVERNTTTAQDRFGQPAAPTWTAQETLPCRGWTTRRQAVRDGQKSVVLHDLKAAFPLSADVREGDRLTSITDRLGAVVYAGPLMVEEIVRRSTHREVRLERP